MKNRHLVSMTVVVVIAVALEEIVGISEKLLFLTVFQSSNPIIIKANMKQKLQKKD